MPDIRSRHEPFFLLAAHGIPSLVWFEDAIASYNVPTVVFDYYLLVADIDKAALTLRQEGWTPDPEWRPKVWNFLGCDGDSVLQWSRLQPPPSSPAVLARVARLPLGTSAGTEPTSTMLMSASAWAVKTSSLRLDHLTPPLHVLVDAFMTCCLDAVDEPTSVWRKTTLMLAYLYEYPQDTKSLSFATQLSGENRAFHREMVTARPTAMDHPNTQKLREQRDKFQATRSSPDARV